MKFKLLTALLEYLIFFNAYISYCKHLTLAEPSYSACICAA